jgi:hypothetical protein
MVYRVMVKHGKIFRYHKQHKKGAELLLTEAEYLKVQKQVELIGTIQVQNAPKDEWTKQVEPSGLTESFDEADEIPNSIESDENSELIEPSNEPGEILETVEPSGENQNAANTEKEEAADTTNENKLKTKNSTKKRGK